MTPEPPQGEVRENPLVPNALLRDLYRTLLSLEHLETTLVKGDPALPNRYRSLAALASLAVSLRPGDVVSEAASNVSLHLLRHANVPHGSARGRLPGDLGRLVELPFMAVATERLLMAIGAAVSLRADGRKRVLVAILEQSDVEADLWEQMLGFVARLELPMLFMVIASKATSRKPSLSSRSTGLGVPGFPVDQVDALALFRVVQESLGRLRAGGGPVLIECLPWKLGSRRVPSARGKLREFLLQRHVATEAMLARMEAR